METRLRLDIPALATPEVQDLLNEADLFARSFSGIGGALGLLSPFDLLRSLTTLGTEIAGHGYVLYSLLRGSHEDSHGLTTGQWFLIASALIPTAMSMLNWFWTWTVSYLGVGDDLDEATDWHHTLYSPKEAETAESHERMRRLAYDESFKSEVSTLISISNNVLIVILHRLCYLACPNGSLRLGSRRESPCWHRTHFGRVREESLEASLDFRVPYLDWSKRPQPLNSSARASGSSP